MSSSRHRWNFHQYVTSSSKEVIEKWASHISKKGRANLDRALDHLRDQPMTEWRRPEASPLGNHIYVIHFKDENRSQWRICGHFYMPHRTFVLTVGVKERDGQYIPEDYEKQATNNRVICDENFYERTVPVARRCQPCTYDPVNGRFYIYTVSSQRAA